MKTPFWRFVFYLDLFACLIAGITVLTSRASKGAVIAFYFTWLVAVIFFQIMKRSNKK